MAVKTSWAAGDVLLAADLTDTFAAKAALAGATYTGTHNFTGATVTGIPSGLALVTPTSVTNGTLSGGEVTFSAQTSVSLNGIFTSTYDNYRVMCEISSASAAANIGLRMRTGGSDAATNYHYGSNSANSAASTGGYVSTADYGTTYYMVGYVNTTYGGAFVTDVISPNIARRTVFFGQLTNLAENFRVSGGDHTTATAYDSFSIFPASGNITGKIRVYGYKNS